MLKQKMNKLKNKVKKLVNLFRNMNKPNNSYKKKQNN